MGKAQYICPLSKLVRFALKLKSFINVTYQDYVGARRSTVLSPPLQSVLQQGVLTEGGSVQLTSSKVKKVLLEQSICTKHVGARSSIVLSLPLQFVFLVLGLTDKCKRLTTLVHFQVQPAHLRAGEEGVRLREGLPSHLREDQVSALSNFFLRHK